MKVISLLALLGALCAFSPAMADNKPTPEMMAPVEQVAHFIATGDDADLFAFASKGVVIVENFAPYLFEGRSAVQRWADGMKTHTSATEALAYTFGPPQDFTIDGDRAYFSLPTRWTGKAGPQDFVEDGGWSFVLVKEKGRWRVLSYGWSVTQITHQ
jgi:hypothetical protein